MSASPTTTTLSGREEAGDRLQQAFLGVVSVSKIPGRCVSAIEAVDGQAERWTGVENPDGGRGNPCTLLVVFAKQMTLKYLSRSYVSPVRLQM